MTRLYKINRLFLTTLCLYLIILMLRYPALSLDYAFTGLNLWFTRMVPTLLPFMILSGIMIRTELTESFVRLLHPLIHCLFGTTKNGSYTIIMGFMCGFPMGARIIGELYASGRLSREESARLLCFCNNIGPIYFLSFVIPVLAIDRPLVPFLIMYGIPMLYGLVLFRAASFFHKGASGLTGSTVLSRAARMPLPAAIDASIMSGLTGIAKLGGYMVFFNLLNIVFVPFHHAPEALLNIYRCILEITSGINYSGPSLLYPVLVLLPFGGFSCIAQTYSMISHTDLSMRAYVFHKLVQTAITALCYCLIYFVRSSHIL